MKTDRQDLKAASMQALRRRLMSGGAWAFGGKILIASAGLVSSALLARLLSPQDLGVYFLAYSIVTLGTSLGALGLTGTVVRFVAEGMARNHFGRVRCAIAVVLGAGTLGALGVGTTYLLYGDDLAETVFDAPALAAIGGLVAGWIMVGTLQGLLAEIFRGFHDIRLATLLGSQTSGTVTGVATIILLTVSLSLLWFFEGQATLATVVLLAICSGAVNTLLAGWLLHRKMAALPRQPPDKGQNTNFKQVLGEVLAVTWPILITNLVMFARINGDIWVLGSFLSQEEVAVYGAANRLVSVVTMPLIMINAIVPPLIAEMYAQGKRDELQRTLRALATVTAIPGFLASIGCIVFASPILGLVYGNYYREGAMVLIILSVALCTSLWTGSSGHVLMMTGYQKTQMIITIACGIVTLSMMVAAVGPYGIIGVAMARLAGYVLQNGLVWLMVKQKTGMWTHIGFKDLFDIFRSAAGAR